MSDVGDPAHVVDHDLEVVVAVGHAGPVAHADRATQEAVTATWRDPAELLVVLMNERPTMGRFLAQAPGTADLADTGHEVALQ